MPVRIRITLLFTLLVFIILGVVCGSVYYSSYTSRINTINTRLVNRAITTARLLTQSELFTRELIEKIDSSTTISLKHKAVKAYTMNNRVIYNYSDEPGDTLSISNDILQTVRRTGRTFFTIGTKEAAAYHLPAGAKSIVVIAAGEDEDGKKTLEELLNILLLSFLGGVIIAFIGGFIFSKQLIKPVKEIADNINDITAQNLARRIKTGTIKDEWYYLSETLNKLLNRLQESFELQRRFISNASHELSTPLTSISSQLEVSMQRERSQEYTRKVMQSIQQDVKHMSKLTQTLLQFAKASENAGGLDITLVRIDEVLMRLPSEIAKISGTYSISMQFDNLPEDESNLLVLGNEELLFTAIKNLVVNACKYSNDGHASVNLDIRDKILVSIINKGIGIQGEELENIFQPFYRTEQVRSAEGVGLGLSLADRIIKLHKGEIKVQSIPGDTTTFTIILPHSKDFRNSNQILMTY